MTFFFLAFLSATLTDNKENFTPFNIPLNFKEKKIAQIIIPKDIQKEEFDKIINWIRIMKDYYE